MEGISIHELIRSVHANGGADDGRPDFLANDIQDLYDRPDTLHLSDGSVQPVSAIYNGTVEGSLSQSSLEVQLTASMPQGYAYLRIPDPGEGKFRLVRVTRADGSEMPSENAWKYFTARLGLGRTVILAGARGTLMFSPS